MASNHCHVHHVCIDHPAPYNVHLMPCSCPSDSRGYEEAD